MRDLAVTLIQCELAWEQPADNRQQIGALINALKEPTDLIVLPEMFTTGFSMNAAANAEEPGGATEQWLRELAMSHDCAITGSIAVREQGGVYNRMLFATPEGSDKEYLGLLAQVMLALRDEKLFAQLVACKSVQQVHDLLSG
jgi:omega-amidase